MRRVIILGAAGRDFHNFNVVFRDDPTVEVVAFTATQIRGIANRTYPPSLAGSRYPRGIPIVAEEKLERIVRDLAADSVVFAYSDVSHETVMHLASRALAGGADFELLGPGNTMLRSTRPVIATTAVRTGCGKSPLTRKIASLLEGDGVRCVVVRHPMPYGDLAQQRVQRFSTREDLDRHHTTLEEREEYEPHLDAGRVVYAGVDYDAILREAEVEADVILWDGGNNDFPFFRSDIAFVVTDPLRAADTLHAHPGEACLRMADVVVINKIDSADETAVARVRADVLEARPGIPIIEARSDVTIDGDIAGKRVVVVEDGPTLTHGGMSFGAGVVAARRFHAAERVDPRPYAVGTIAEVLRAHPRLERLVPAIGYDAEQIADLGATLRAVPADLILDASPVDLTRILELDKPVVRVRYAIEQVRGPDLHDLLEPIAERVLIERARLAANVARVAVPSARRRGRRRRAAGRLVIALGGNALLQRGERGEFELVKLHVATAARAVADAIGAGREVVVTHGNGPQVGFLALEAEAAEPAVPAPPFDVLGAESQGQIGYLLEQALRAELCERGISREVAVVVTQTVVSADDPALKTPSKPVGPVYDELTATRLAAERGWTIGRDGTGFRRLVPSPRPRRLVEGAAIRALVEAGTIVVASGGGGVPVIDGPDGSLHGVEGVVDKDLAAVVLADTVGAEELVILTDVAAVERGWRTPSAAPIRQTRADELFALLEQGAFERGTMEPKCRAAVEFVRAGGHAVHIGALRDASAVLRGEAGTTVRAA